MAMKLNIAYPTTGAQKVIEVEDEKKLRPFFDRRMSEEVPADTLGDDFKGYVFRITGGADKEGFAMKQGVLINHRTRLVLDGTTGHYRPKRKGCRKRKSVRGCICGPDLSVINLVIIKKGPKDLPGLTDPDSARPSLRGPKRASKIRKLWGLTKDDDVRQFVSRKKLPADEKHKKDRYKSPKIQRLITPQRLQRKRRLLALRKRRYEKNQKQASEYAKLLSKIRKDKRETLLSKKRAHRNTESVKGQAAAAPAQPGALAAGVPHAQKGATEGVKAPNQPKGKQQGGADKGAQKPKSSDKPIDPKKAAAPAAKVPAGHGQPKPPVPAGQQQQQAAQVQQHSQKKPPQKKGGKQQK